MRIAVSDFYYSLRADSFENCGGCASLKLAFHFKDFSDLVVDAASLLLIIQAPGLMRLPLDEKEAQLVLGISRSEYDYLCDVGLLQSTTHDRDYFLPLLKHHTAWDLMRCYFVALNVGSELKQFVRIDDAIEDVASMIDSLSDCGEALAPSMIALEMMKTFRGLNLGPQSELHLLKFLTRFGSFCGQGMKLNKIHRLRDGS